MGRYGSFERTTGTCAVRLVAIMVATTVLASWLAGDYFRLGLFVCDAWVRPTVVVYAALSGVVLGSATALLHRIALGRRAWVAPVVLAPALGGLLPFLPGLEWTARTLPGAASSCVAVGAMSGPVLALLGWIVMRGERARPGSVVGAADRRLPWIVLSSAGMAALPIVIRGAPQFRLLYWPGLELTVLLGAGLFVTMTGLVVADIAGWLRVRRLVRKAGVRRHVPISEIAITETVLDLGIGEMATCTSPSLDGAPYRQGAGAGPVLLGEGSIALRLLDLAVLRGLCSMAFLTIWSVAGVSLGLPQWSVPMFDLEVKS